MTGYCLNHLFFSSSFSRFNFDELFSHMSSRQCPENKVRFPELLCHTCSTCQMFSPSGNTLFALDKGWCLQKVNCSCLLVFFMLLTKKTALYLKRETTGSPASASFTVQHFGPVRQCCLTGLLLLSSTIHMIDTRAGRL